MSVTINKCQVLYLLVGTFLSQVYMRLSGYTWPVPGMARKLSGPLNCILHVANYLKAMQQTYLVFGHYGSEPFINEGR